MTVLVTGGSGFIGSHLLECLIHRGFKNVVSIDNAAPQHVVEGVDYRLADVRNFGSLDFKSQVDTIFHLAAVHTTPGHDPWEYYDTNVSGTLQVARFAKERNVKSIIFTSSISVYGPSENPKDEQAIPTPNSDYGRSKLIAERILENWRDGDAERKLVVARPSVVFGPREGGNFTRLASLLKKGWFFYPGRRNTIKSCIYVSDLIDWMLYAEQIQKKYTLFNGAYLERCTTEEIVDLFRQVAFPNIREITVPSRVLRGAALAIKLSGISGMGIHPERIDKLLKSTNIFPGWAVENNLNSQGRLKEMIKHWHDVSEGTFK